MGNGSYDDRYEREREREWERKQEQEYLEQAYEREQEEERRFLEFLEYWAEYEASDDEPKTREGYYRWVDYHWQIGRLRAIRDERNRGIR